MAGGVFSAMGPTEDAAHASYCNYNNSLHHASCNIAAMHFRAALEDVQLAMVPIIDTVDTVLYLEWSLPWRSLPPPRFAFGRASACSHSTTSILHPLHNSHNLSTSQQPFNFIFLRYHDSHRQGQGGPPHRSLRQARCGLVIGFHLGPGPSPSPSSGGR
jgi:hypothetical protein